MLALLISYWYLLKFLKVISAYFSKFYRWNILKKLSYFSSFVFLKSATIFFCIFNVTLYTSTSTHTRCLEEQKVSFLVAQYRLFWLFSHLALKGKVKNVNCGDLILVFNTHLMANISLQQLRPIMFYLEAHEIDQ